MVALQVLGLRDELDGHIGALDGQGGGALEDQVAGEGALSDDIEADALGAFSAVAQGGDAGAVHRDGDGGIPDTDSLDAKSGPLDQHIPEDLDDMPGAGGADIGAAGYLEALHRVNRAGSVNVHGDLGAHQRCRAPELDAGAADDDLGPRDRHVAGEVGSEAVARRRILGSELDLGSVGDVGGSHDDEPLGASGGGHGGAAGDHEVAVDERAGVSVVDGADVELDSALDAEVAHTVDARVQAALAPDGGAGRIVAGDGEVALAVDRGEKVAGARGRGGAHDGALALEMDGGAVRHDDRRVGVLHVRHLDIRPLERERPGGSRRIPTPPVA